MKRWAESFSTLGADKNYDVTEFVFALRIVDKK